MNYIASNESLERLSLFDLYAELRKVNPAKELISDIMEATGRSEISVRMWLSTHRPPPLPVQNLIAKKLGVARDILFPDNNKNS